MLALRHSRCLRQYLSLHEGKRYRDSQELHENVKAQRHAKRTRQAFHAFFQAILRFSRCLGTEKRYDGKKENGDILPGMGGKGGVYPCLG